MSYQQIENKVHQDAAKRNQIHGEAKSWWVKPTNGDMDRGTGKFNVFIGLLQGKYGYSHQNAIDEIDKRVSDYEANLKKVQIPAPSE
jgi:uncharacterized protein YjbJ (UPF0337 family)